MPRWSPLPFPGTSGLASHCERWEFGQLGDLYFDVMTRLGDAANFDTVEAVVKDFSGTRVPVATPKALCLLKKSTVRPIDRHDAAELRSRFNLTKEE